MYFWDTYAILEFINGNPAYLKFNNYPFVLTIFNLAEVYYFSIKEYEHAKANAIYDECEKGVLQISDDILKQAMHFRRSFKRNISYTDAIGYITAKGHNLIFLTGDKEFEHLENVEFVK